MDELQTNPIIEGQEVVVEPQETEQHTEVAEVVEPQKQSAEDNRIAASARREAESKAKALEDKIRRLEDAAKKGGFTSVDDLTEAYERQLRDQEEFEKRSRLEERGIDPDVYEEMIQNDPRVKEAMAFKQEQETYAQRQKSINEFLDYFQEAMGRPYDSTKDTLSKEVEQMASQGIPLVVAYKAVEETNSLKKELSELKEKLEANETNKKNSASSTGDITVSNPKDSDFISKELFESNKSDQRWVIKNLDKISKSRTKW